MKMTPYLTAHPEYSDLLVRMGSDPRLYMDGEYASLAIFDGERVVWSGKEVLLFNLFNEQPPLFHYQGSKTLKYALLYMKVRKGSTYRKKLWLSPPKIKSFYKNGKVKVELTPENLRYPSAIRKVRAGVSGWIKSPKVAQQRPINSPLRPSPETQNTGYLEVTEGEGIFGGDYFLTVVPKSRLLKQRTWTGVRTPNFSKLRPSQYPVNPHTVSIKVVTQDGPCVLLKDQRGYNIPPVSKFFRLWITSHTLNYAAPADPVHLPLALNKAIRNAVDRAGVGIEANLAQDLGTLGQIVGLIGNNAKKITQSIINLKKGNLSGAVDSLFAGRPRKFQRGGPSRKRDLADNWLELQYGWKPLLNDIHGVFDSLSVFNEPQGFVHRVTASATARKRETSSFPAHDPNSNAKGVNTIDTQTRASLVLRFKIESPLRSFLAQTGFTNPVNLAWELLPFSFVVDWFLPIGPFLETLSSWDGLTLLDGCQTIFTRQIAASAIDGSGKSVLDSSLNIDLHSSYRREWILLSRSRLTSFPKSSFPELKNGLASVDHALNGIALLVKSFGR